MIEHSILLFGLTNKSAKPLILDQSLKYGLIISISYDELIWRDLKKELSILKSPFHFCEKSVICFWYF